MKKSLFTPILVIAVLAFGGCKSEQQRVHTDQKSARIGVLVPLTGPAAEIGKSLQNGLLLGEAKVNASLKLGDIRIELIFEDTGGQVKNALSAYRRLESQGVNIFYTLMSSHAMALKPLIEEKNGRQLLFANASLPSITENCENIIRHANVGQRDAEVLMGGLKDYSKVAIIYQNDEWATGTADLMKQKLQAASVSIAVDNFNPEQTSNNVSLIKLLKFKPDAFLLISYGEFLGRDIRTLRQLNYQGPIYTAAGWTVTRSAALAIAGQFADSLYFVDFRRSESFDLLYQQRYGDKPAAFSYMAFTDMELLSHVLNMESTQLALAKRIKELKTFAGTYEQLTIYPNGDIPADTFLNQEKFE